MVGKCRLFALETRANARFHRFRVDERVVHDEKQFFRDFDGEMAHGFRPILELVEVDAQDPVDDEIRGNGDVRAFMGHGRALSRVAVRGSR